MNRLQRPLVTSCPWLHFRTVTRWFHFIIQYGNQSVLYDPARSYPASSRSSYSTIFSPISIIRQYRNQSVIDQSTVPSRPYHVNSTVTTQLIVTSPRLHYGGQQFQRVSYRSPVSTVTSSWSFHRSPKHTIRCLHLRAGCRVDGRIVEVALAIGGNRWGGVGAASRLTTLGHRRRVKWGEERTNRETSTMEWSIWIGKWWD